VATTTLPYAVDNDFAATGYVGDYSSISNTPTCTVESPASPRAATAKCWTVVYNVPAVGNDAGITPAGYAGVAWQSNVQPMNNNAYYNNFGVAHGVTPPAGATEMSLWAKGAVGGEVVTFGVGSSGDNPCTDSIQASAMFTLTTTWTRYTIPFPVGATYTAGQVNGFSWNAPAPGDAGVVTFYVDDVEWDNTPDAGGAAPTEAGADSSTPDASDAGSSTVDATDADTGEGG
jgi:hypothetical protein